MKNFLRTCALLVILSGVAAHADTISYFTFTGTPVANNDPNTVSGSLIIDTTTGVVESVSFTAAGVYQSGVDSQAGPQVTIGSTKSSLSFSAGSLIKFNGASFNLRTPTDLYVGHTSAALPVVTPEPSSIGLLVTGLLAMAGMLRRSGAAQEAAVSAI